MDSAREMNNVRELALGVYVKDNTASFAQHRQKKMRLGQLLIEAELVSPDGLHEALTIASQSGEQVGKVLSTLRYVSEKNMQSALLAQSLVTEGIIDERSAVRALKKATLTGISLVEVLDESAADRAVVDGVLELEQLVLRANLVSHSAFEEAKSKSQTEGVPFGRALILTHGIAFSLLSCALEAVARVREGRLNADEAVRALKEVKKTQDSLEDALHNLKISPKSTVNRIKLGDLLTSGKVITERDNLAAVERSLIERRMLGEILVASGLVPCGILRETLTLQTMVMKGVISIDSAVVTLRKIKEERLTLAEAAAKTHIFADKADVVSVIWLLVLAEIINEAMCDKAVQIQKEYSLGPLKALVASEILCPITHRAALAADRLIGCGQMTEAEAVLALQTVDRVKCTLDDAIAEIRGKNSKRSDEVTHREVKTALVGKQKERKAARVAISLRVILSILAGVAFACAAVWFIIPVDCHVLAMALVAMFGSVAVFFVGRGDSQQDAEEQVRIVKETEEARGMLSRLKQRI